MSRLLILGVSPLPFESTQKSFGPGTRTWQLTEPLLDDGHEVLLVGMRIPMTYPDDAPIELVERRGRLNYASITGELYFQSPYVQNVYDDFQPDAVIFAHGSASFADSILDASVPDLDRSLRPRHGRGAGQSRRLWRRLVPGLFLPQDARIALQGGCVLHRLGCSGLGTHRRARHGRSPQLAYRRRAAGAHDPVRRGGGRLPA